MNNENILVAANRISVYRDQNSILEGVSVELRERDFVTVIGPNGAGKSMLLKCLMGFYTPNKGSVTRRTDLVVGYVPQSLTPDHALPISCARFICLGKEFVDGALHAIAAQTDVSHLLHKPLHVLSGGELQRVLLARALITRPHLLILDEPAQQLDFSGQLSFYRLLQRIYSEHPIGILMVSHDLHFVMSCTQRVVCLFRHVCCSGTPQTITRDPEFISLFGHDMAKMMAVYQHHHDHGHDQKHHQGHGSSHNHDDHGNPHPEHLS